MTAYPKAAVPVAQIVQLLIDRGLQVPDRAEAERLLTAIGHFRLTGYMLRFQQHVATPLEHQFDAGTTFQGIIDCYFFDRRLRLLVMDAIERIEVAVRAALTNETAVVHGINWFADPKLFNDQKKHAEILTTIERQLQESKDALFLKHFYQNYTSPPYPPSWMTMEVLSIGTLSRLFSRLTIDEQKRVGKVFGLHRKMMVSWLRSISYMRNVCAHHSRLYDRRMTIRPLVLTGYEAEFQHQESLYAALVVLQIFMRRVAPRANWGDDVKSLFADAACPPLAVMSFPAGWEQRAVWS